MASLSELELKYQYLDSSLIQTIESDYRDDIKTLHDILKTLNDEHLIIRNNLEFLKSTFESYTHHQLSTLFDLNGNNVEATFDYILSKENLTTNSSTSSNITTDNKSSNDNNSTDATSEINNVDDYIKQPIVKKKKKKKKNVNKHFDYYHYSNNGNDNNDNDAWIVIDSIASAIYRQIRIPHHNLFLSLLNAIKSNKFDTLSSALLTYLDSLNFNLDTESYGLFIALIQIQDFTIAKIIFKACDNRIEDALDVIETYYSLRESEHTLVDEEENNSKTSEDIKDTTNVIKRTKSAPPPQPSTSYNVGTGWQKVKKRNVKQSQVEPVYHSHLPHYNPNTITNKQNETSFVDESSDYCREVEFHYRQKRIQTLNESSRVYKAGKNWKDGSGSVAALAKSEEARVYGQIADEWAIKAAKSHISKKSNLSDEIDLHYLTVNEAVAVAKDCVYRWWSRKPLLNKEITSLNSLTFITGVGIHSTGRKPILFPAVSKALESDGWKLEKQMSRGMIIVRGRA